MLVLAAVVVALARQVGTLHLRLGPRGALEIDSEGPPLGEAPPPLPATADDGDARAGRRPRPRAVGALLVADVLDLHGGRAGDRRGRVRGGA